MSEQVLELSTGRVVCRVCGEKFDLQLPQDVVLVGAVVKAFTKVHKRCRKKR